MKYYSIDWALFLRQLANWADLDTPIRRLCLEMDKHRTAIIDTPEALENREVLLRSGFVESASDGVRVKLSKPSLSFFRTIRFMQSYPVSQLCNPTVFGQYVKLNFTLKEFSSFFKRFGQTSGSVIDLYNQISSVNYVDELFSNHDRPEWEYQRLTDEEDSYITNSYRFDCFLRFLRFLIEQGAPVYLHELDEMDVEELRPFLPEIVLAGIRHLFLFCSLDDETLLPTISLFPKIITSIYRERPTEPDNIDVKETLSYSILDDLTVLLQECASAPIRMLKNQYELFKKAKDVLFSRFFPLPEPLQDVLEMSHEWRLRHALILASSLKLARQAKLANKTDGLVLTAKGKTWLQSSAKDKMLSLVDYIKKELEFYGRLDCMNYELHDLHVLGMLGFDSFSKIKHIFSDDLYSRFVPYSQFLAYQGRVNNPLVSFLEQNKSHWAYHRFQHITSEQLEDMWVHILDRWLIECLLPFECIEIGYDQDSHIAIRVTDIGRYLFGFVNDFDYFRSSSDQAAVLPNFEIVFMKPAPQAEISLNPFCERIGSKTGGVFRISADSIRRAIALGWTAEQIVFTLNDVSKNEIPVNVKHEILEWAGQVKLVHVKQVFLIHSPDEDTTEVIRSAAPKDVTVLNATTLAVGDRKKKDAILNAIRKKGVYLKSD